MERTGRGEAERGENGRNRKEIRYWCIKVIGSARKIFIFVVSVLFSPLAARYLRRFLVSSRRLLVLKVVGYPGVEEQGLEEVLVAHVGTLVHHVNAVGCV